MLNEPKSELRISGHDGITGRCLCLMAVFVYAVAFHFSYSEFVQPAFHYAHLFLFERDWADHVLCYLLILIPGGFVGSRPSPSGIGAVLIYVAYYVPTQIMVHLGMSPEIGDKALISVLLFVSMILIFLVSRCFVRRAREGGHQSLTSIDLAVRLLCFFAIALAVFRHGGQMSFVSFDNVYDHRALASGVQKTAIEKYLFMWMSYCLIPYLLAVGLLKKDNLLFLIAVAASLVVYAMTAAKSSLFIVAAMIVLNFLPSRPDRMLLVVCSCLGVVIVSLVLWSGAGVVYWLKSILLFRTLSTGGWTMNLYHEFFSENPLTYYSHIGVIRNTFGGYPYGDLALGQVIGESFLGKVEANLNAGFWVSDGIAALGVWGIPVSSVFVALFFAFLNVVSRGYCPKFMALWLAGFWFALINLPFSVVVLSGGGGLVLALLIFDSELRKYRAEALLKAL